MMENRRGSFDPRRNPLSNLIDFVATGVDVPMEEGAAVAAPRGGEDSTDMDVEMSMDNPMPATTKATSPEKKKKDKKKDKKKKDKKKKKKHKEGEDGGSDLELDSDDDLSLGSMPMSSSSDDDEEEEATAGIGGLSRQVSKRASMAADGLKGMQLQMNFQKPIASPQQQQSQANSSKRRHTLGAALKGFQIDATSNNDSSSGLDNLSGLSKNLPTLSVSGVRQKSRRQSNFDVFLKNTASSDTSTAASPKDDKGN